MPKFTFKLEGVLSLRRREEQRRQRDVAERVARAAEARTEVERLNRDLVAAVASLRDGKLVGSVDVAYLASHRRYTNDVARRGSEQMRRLALAERDVNEARAKLVEATRQRKVLETLRDKHEARWRSEIIRRELAEADDAAGRWSEMIRRDEAEQDARAEAEVAA